jgi:hypothetical protein
MYLYAVIITLTKISIILLYLRIFPTRGFVIRCYCLIGFIVAFFVGAGFAVTFTCSPLSLMWTLWDGEHTGTCGNVNAMVYAVAGINMTLDVTIFLFPLPQVLRLQMNWRKKAAIALIFSVGLL